MAFMLADRNNRPVEEYLDMPLPRLRQWIAYCQWRDAEEEKRQRGNK